MEEVSGMAERARATRGIITPLSSEAECYLELPMHPCMEYEALHISLFYVIRVTTCLSMDWIGSNYLGLSAR